ncbi:MAG: DNA-directed RNA polymerase subunit omega [Thermotogae bacterium]|jgi:DNA-directed RNA polymerase subunit omega|nr:DNA-directed RNA polymerase subunit omega [Thermotogota bacterium]MCP5465605.1 DNA-directed RNA polymerase subunit omega [Thermotogota bacterium]HOO74155.1 DNA-directed RNA polymerase subunit omega [Tepiditoga sp.]
MNTGFNYDKIMDRVKLKYAVPIIAAKRAERIKNSVNEEDDININFVTVAFKEIEEGKTIIKDMDKLDFLKTELEG